MRLLVGYIAWMCVVMSAWYLHRRLDDREDLSPRQVKSRRVALFAVSVAGLFAVVQLG